MLGAAASGALALGLTSAEVTRILDLQDDLVSAGSTSLIVSASRPGGVDAVRCEQLNTVEGVRAAGARGSLLSSETDGAKVRAVTRGYAQAVLPGMDPASEVIAGATAAESRHLISGSGITSPEQSIALEVDAVASPSLRDPRVNAEVLVIHPPTFSANSCLVVAEPDRHAGVDALLTTWFGADDVLIAPLIARGDVTDSPQSLLESRPGRMISVVAGAGSLMMLLAAWMVRRSDFALYRLLGAEVGALTAGLCLEATVLVVAPQLATSAFTFCAFPQMHSGAGLESALLAVGQLLASDLVAVPLGIALLFIKNPFSLVREGT